ncbi:hypothetical protein FGO68_gene471 [Halteria grandinella]|uniref:Uncharacterized protein n=1 Tax=Halteria grandinella TaxID=5974 RepID=A0A8J8STV0_HALGN|nr:hypothetical protein FGO68_gene471 [Halteria grandinella]
MSLTSLKHRCILETSHNQFYQIQFTGLIYEGQFQQFKPETLKSTSLQGYFMTKLILSLMTPLGRANIL